MAHKRMKPWQKATALVPLALLSGAWTTSIAATSTATAAGDEPRQVLPDGTFVPTEAIENPASVSLPAAIDADGALPSGTATQAMISDASPNGIPAAALAAYQRAAQVINAADPGCNLSWELIAAIGRVESDHGRYGGNVLDDDGISQPGIYGIPLDGTNGTAKIPDTDAGELDNDPVWDRAVGPMQFIPSTWAIVGVDADGDGVRNPQSIHDAALASSVYLCSGNEDLSTTPGQRTAVFRYNHSNAYVDLVLQLMRAYRTGDYSAVPNGTVNAAMLTPNKRDSVVSKQTQGRKPQNAKGKGKGGNGGNTGGQSSNQPSNPQQPGGSTGGDTAGVDSPAPSSPTKPVEDAAKDTKETVEKTVKNVLTPLEKAQATCQANFTSAEITALGGLTACAEAVLSGGLSSVENTLKSLTGSLLGN
ncbi:MAG: lytic transglycosylase domain-containing protein [Nocardioides sp.]|nr:lytic transglycosylase domain-containing protein [Nocardioides sp.]